MTRLVIENAPDDPRSHRNAGLRPAFLGVWVEPLGEDYWIARGQRLAFAAASSPPEVDCIWHQQGVSVWFGDADAYGVVVTTDGGEVVEGGYQRKPGRPSDGLVVRDPIDRSAAIRASAAVA